MPVGTESRHRDAVRMDPESLPGLHPRLPLLLCARRHQTQFELGVDDEFSSIIFVKTNLVDVLRRELQRSSWTGQYVAVGTATDCYQPIEGHYKLTRRPLEAMRDFNNPVGVVTPRDRWSCATRTSSDLTAGPGCGVYISVPTVDEDAWQMLEPGHAPPCSGCGRPRARRRRNSRGCPDEPNRAGHHVQTCAARTHP